MTPDSLLQDSPDSPTPLASSFVLLERRWGNEEGHSFPLGVYSSLEEAKKDAYLYYVWRDRKYLPEIFATSERNEDGVQDGMNSVYGAEDFMIDLQAGAFKDIQYEFKMYL